MRIIYSLVAISIILIVSCNDTKYMQGMRIYQAKCQNCHMDDGSGLGKLIPALSTSKKLGDLSAICIIRNGILDTIYNEDSTFLIREMPSFKKYSAAELTNIINYMNDKWSSDFKEVTILEVQSKLDECQ